MSKIENSRDISIKELILISNDENHYSLIKLLFDNKEFLKDSSYISLYLLIKLITENTYLFENTYINNILTKELSYMINMVDKLIDVSHNSYNV